jgi:antitoxin component of MazEF toxin-antitoxin module
MELKLGARRLQALGNSLYVSLPNIWVQTLGLKKGDKVAIDLMNDGSLKILH